MKPFSHLQGWVLGRQEQTKGVCVHTRQVCILGAKGLQLRDTPGPIGISTINNQFKFPSLAGLYWRPVPSRMPTDHPLCPVQGSSNTLEENVRQGEGGGTGVERKESVSYLCLGNTCSPRLWENRALFTSVYTIDSELGSILGDQMALWVQGKSGHTKLLTTHEGVGEASCILDLIDVLENFPMCLVQQTPKHMSLRNLFICLYFKPLCIFRTMESICSCFISLNSLKWCSVSAIWCPQSLLLPFYEHFEACAFRIQEPAKPDLNRTQLGLKFKTLEAPLDLIFGKISSLVPDPLPRRLLQQAQPQKKG